MKKICIAISAACFIALAGKNSAFADTMCMSSVDSGGNVNLSIVSDSEEEQLYTVYIMDADASLDDGAGGKHQEGVIRLEQVMLSPDKSKKYNKAIKDIRITGAGKMYKAVIGGGELTGKTLMMVYPKKAVSDRAAEAITSANESSIDVVLNEYQNKAWVLDFDNEMYKSYKSEVCRRLNAMTKENGFDINQITKMFNNSCALTRLAHCSKSDFYTVLLKNEYSLDINLSANIHMEKDKIAEAFINLRKDNSLLLPSDLETLMRQSEALGILNESTRENVMQILNEYNDVFDLNFNGDYKKVDSYSVMKKMTPCSYRSIGEVQTAFNNAVSSLVPDKTTPSQSSPGGSGSAGGGGGTPNKRAAQTGSVNIAAQGNYVTADMVESITNSEGFSDISEAAWAEIYITYFRSRNILSGYGDGTVHPNAAVTREEFLKLLIGAMNPQTAESEETEEAEETAEFSDVDKNSWYGEYVEKAAKLGIVYGRDDGTFGAGDGITREDAAVMIYRTVEINQKILADTAELMEFIDESDISSYALNPVKTMQKAGIISGYTDGSFMPKNSITRAESVKMLYSILKNINEL